MQTVIILDGETKSALAAVRTLVCAGVRVVVGSEYSTAMGKFSRGASMRFTYPSPRQDQAGFLAALAKVAQEQPEAPFLFTFSDATYLTIARHAKELAGCCQLRLPSLEAVETAFSKVRTAALAREHGIPTIREYVPPEMPQAFPAVLKPQHSVSWHAGTGVFHSAEFVFSMEAYIQTAASLLAQTGEEPVVQEYIVGAEYGVECLVQAGEIVMSFTHRRVRSLSPRGGASTVKEKAPDDEKAAQMYAYTKTLVSALAWEGPIMAEYKVDDRTGEITLMELNGRFWGSLPLPVAAGVDFPVWYAQLAAGADANASAPAATGITRTQHFLGDCRWLFAVFFTSDPLRATLYPNRLSALRDFLFDTFFTRGDVFSWRDPLPSILEIINVLEKKLWK